RSHPAPPVPRRPLSFPASTAPCFTEAGQENFTAMVAAIGTGGIPRPNRRLLSHASRLPLRSLPAFDKTVTLTWENPAGAPLTRVTRSAQGILIETGGTSVRVGLREWAMPLGRGVRERFVCRGCGAVRDALHWVGEWWWRGRDSPDLEHACRHTLRWCPAVGRRARLLRKLARLSPRGLQARLLQAQIAHEQQAMIANLKLANRDLTKRSRRHARHG